MDRAELCFPHLNNSCVKLKRNFFNAVSINILVSSISLLIGVLNLLVIISISHFKQLQTPTNIIILSLSVSDFFVSWLLFFQVLFMDGCWPFSDILCSVFVTFDFLITSASVGNIVLISVDRYMAICDPLRYSTKVSKQKVEICVGLCWICSLIMSIVILRDNLKYPGKYKACDGACFIAFDSADQTADLIVTFCIPVMLIIFLYVRLFIVAISQARAMRSQITAIMLHSSKSVKAKKTELKAVKSVGIVVLAFVICIFPYFYVKLAKMNVSFDIISGEFVSYLFYFNSFLNPLIYGVFYPWFRKSIKLILTLQILQPGSCDRNML